jgi:CMP-N-acetylneuraminic acid synthetase
MKKKINQIAIIPARKNSKGLKLKNRLLFDYTEKFLKKIKWFDEIIFASDDDYFISKCKKANFFFYKRNKKNAKDDSSIKSLMQEVSKELNLDQETILWLFYLTIPDRKLSDFKALKSTTKENQFLSAMSFLPSQTHPYDCWIINKKLKKFIKNDVYRRQDKIKLFEHHHYLCAFKVKELNKLNSELINSNTYPLILNKKIIEVDTKEDLNKFINSKYNS